MLLQNSRGWGPYLLQIDIHGRRDPAGLRVQSAPRTTVGRPPAGSLVVVGGWSGGLSPFGWLDG